jgi:hypothetical protein
MIKMLSQNKVKVHAWGGLGSQLFALALILDLQIKFPGKKFSLVLHSSGVTKRSASVNFVVKELEIIIIDDFKMVTNVVETSKRKIFSRILKNILMLSGFLATANNNNEYRKIRPWVRSIRGHYSHRALSDEVLIKIHGLLTTGLNFRNNGLKLNKLAIHYRLGDLLYLENKKPVPNEQIINILRDIRKDLNISRIDLYSDSLEHAAGMLKDVFDAPNIKMSDPEINLVILNLINYEIFVGTNSKISIWATLFRTLINPTSQSFIPIQMKEEIARIYPDIFKLTNIKLY